MNQLRSSLAVAVIVALSACERVAVGPHPATSAPAEQAAATPIADLRPYEGHTYAALAADPAMRRYALDSLGLSAAERSRFEYSMSRPAPGLIAGGGGTEALVFSGCAPSGCLGGLSVVAIDIRTGDVFVGVSDANGADELAPNDRLEALLRLTSPSQNWDDPIRPSGQSPAAP